MKGSVIFLYVFRGLVWLLHDCQHHGTSVSSQSGEAGAEEEGRQGREEERDEEEGGAGGRRGSSCVPQYPLGL